MNETTTSAQPGGGNQRSGERTGRQKPLFQQMGIGGETEQCGSGGPEGPPHDSIRAFTRAVVKVAGPRSGCWYVTADRGLIVTGAGSPAAILDAAEIVAFLCEISLEAHRFDREVVRMLTHWVGGNHVTSSGDLPCTGKGV